MTVHSKTFLSLTLRSDRIPSQSMKAHLSPWRHHTVSHAAQPSPSSPLVRWQEQLIYIDNAGHLRTLLYDHSWKNPLLNQFAPEARGDALAVDDEGGAIFYVTQEGTICRLSESRGHWTYEIIKLKATPCPNAALCSSEDRIYYVAEDRRIYILYFDGQWSNHPVSKTAPLAQNGELCLLETRNLFYTTFEGDLCNLHLPNRSRL